MEVERSVEGPMKIEDAPNGVSSVYRRLPPTAAMILTGRDHAHHHSMRIARPDTVGRCGSARHSPRRHGYSGARFPAFGSQAQPKVLDLDGIRASSALSKSDVRLHRAFWNICIKLTDAPIACSEFSDAIDPRKRAVEPPNRPVEPPFGPVDPPKSPVENGTNARNTNRTTGCCGSSTPCC